MHEQRLDWAHRALQEFNETLDAETSTAIGKGGPGEAHVVVYGKTQVGKTSLILDLMGISPEFQPNVSRVLRGGRKAGQSATAIATVYRRSPDNFWYLSYRNGIREKFEHAPRMKRALGRIRRQMGARELQPSDRCTLSIPACCFASENDAPAMRILDLPGIEARDPAEKQYVAAVAREYLPSSDLILLVGRADDLGFLKPEGLKLPGIDDWQLVPERFRVVTTFSFTPESVVELAYQSRGQLDASLFRQRLFQQLGRSGIRLEERAKVESRFFLLEFGDSWRNGLTGRHSELFREVAPVIDGMKADLQTDIASSAGEYARFENACRVHVVAARVKLRRLQESERRLEGIEKGLEGIKRHVAQLVRQARQVGAGKRSIQARRAKLLDVSVVGRIDSIARGHEEAIASSTASVGLETGKVVTSYSDLVAACARRKSVSDFKGLRDAFKHALHDDAIGRCFGAAGVVSELPKMRAWSDKDDLSKRLREAIENAMSQITAQLSGRWSDGYFPFWFKHADDARLLEKSMRRAHSAVDECVYEDWSAGLKVTVENLNSELAELNQRFFACMHMLRDAKARLDKKRGLFATETSARNDLASRLEEDEASKDAFLSCLDNAYLQDLRRRRKAVMDMDCSTARAIELLAGVQMIHQRKKLRERLG